MSILLIIYLAGLLGFEGKAVYDYHYEEPSRVITNGERLALDTVGAVIWPITATININKELKN